MPTSRHAQVANDRRRSPGRRRLARDQIVASALALLDEEGQEALTLRCLAQRLESGTATLYRHFDSRADLLAEVMDSILSEILVDTELAEMTWQDACATLASAMFDVMCKHRNAAPLLAQHIQDSPTAMLQREGALALLLSSGFSPGLAARAYATVSRHVLGFAMQFDRGSVAEQEEDEAGVAAYVHNLDPEQFPATRAAAHVMPVPLGDEFEFGLRLITAGLEAARASEIGD